MKSAIKKTITLEEAYVLVTKQAYAVFFEGNLVSVSFEKNEGITGDPENEILFLGWTDKDGLSYNAKICEGENQTVVTYGSNLIFIDNEGEELELALAFIADSIPLYQNRMEIFEAARMGFADADSFDELAEKMDVSDEHLSGVRDTLQEFLDEQ